MIIKGFILLILVIGAFAFLGIKIAESIPQKEIKLFFFGLYAVTIFTVFNVIISIYFFVKLQDKRGPRGRKGLLGIPGDSGERGVCDTDGSCKFKTLELMLKNYVEDGTDIVQINEAEKNIICKFVNLIKECPGNTNKFNKNYLDNIKGYLDANRYTRTNSETDGTSLKNKLETLTRTPMHNGIGADDQLQKTAGCNAVFNVENDDFANLISCHQT